MKRMLIATLLLLTSASVVAQEKPAEKPWYEKTKIGVVAFGDYYWVAESHKPNLEGENGFWFRRIYLTFDYKVADDLSARLRFEGNHPGDFISSADMEPFIKDAWLKWNATDRTDLIVGIQQTPTFNVIEEVWGYRALEKTPADLHRLGSSRDFGVSLTGKLDEAKRVGYHLMVGNGNGVRNETNTGKFIGGWLSFAPTGKTYLQIYADHNDRPGASDRTTLQGFGSYDAGRWRTGIHLIHQERETAGGDVDLDLASIFGVWKLKDDVSLIARFDRLNDPNPEAARVSYMPYASNAKVNFLLVGVDLQLHRNAGIIPNVEYLSYEAVGGGADPDSDLVPRLTFYVKF